MTAFRSPASAPCVSRALDARRYAPERLGAAGLRNVGDAGEMNGVRVFVTVMSPGSRTTPLTSEARSQFASYAAAIVRGAPSIRNVIVGNEPNLNRFWLPSSTSTARAPRPATTSRSSRRPTTRLRRCPPTSRSTAAPSPLVEATARTGSGHALADALHPGARPRVPCERPHAPGDGRLRPARVRGQFEPVARGRAPEHDDDRRRRLPEARRTARRGVRRNGAAGLTLPIVYGEFGVESQIPASKAALYSGDEPTTTKPVDETTQATYYGRHSRSRSASRPSPTC